MIKTTGNVKEANAITHSGVFHADEIFATVILEDIFDNITVARIPTIKDLDGIDTTNAIVYDIGCGPLDHHQKEGNGTRDNGVPYASCGLVWKNYAWLKYGRSTIDHVDKNLIQCIDAHDNGINCKPDTGFNVLTVSNIISMMNPTWDIEDTGENFVQACYIAKTIYKAAIKRAVSFEKAEKAVKEAIDSSEGGVMVLDKFMPWQNTLLYDFGEKSQNIKFVVFPSNRGGYNCQCVPKGPGIFENKVPLPEEWRGLTNEELVKSCRVDGAIFCHPAGFLCSNETLEGAVAMAKAAIREYNY